jgi:hypothetical protein
MVLYLWYIVPEILRFLAHVLVAFRATENQDKDILLTSNYLIWMWDVIVRLVFVIIIFWGANTIPGTQHYVRDRFANITQTIAYMTAA